MNKPVNAERPQELMTRDSLDSQIASVGGHQAHSTGLLVDSVQAKQNDAGEAS